MRKHFDFYGYNAPTCGKYYRDNEVYSLGEDFRNVRSYKDYKDIGFTLCLLQHDNSYNGEKWAKSSSKKCLDVCLKVGLKVILEDKRLKALCKEPLLVGAGGKFNSEEELMVYLDEMTKPYRDHPAFYAIQLLDEPEYKHLKEYAHVHRALKKLLPNVELQCNLKSIVLHERFAPDPEHLQTREKDLEDYIRYFQKESGVKYLMTDEYPFRGANKIADWTIPTYQVYANTCKDLGIELRLVLQSFGQEVVPVNSEKPNEVDGSVYWRRITEKEMYWQMNMALGLGCKEFSYFTYFTKARINFKSVWSGGDALDGAALVNLDGTKSKLYFATKKIIKEFKEFEPVIIDYQYDNAYFFFPEGKGKNDFDCTNLAILSDVKNLPISVKTPKYPVLVTEMKKGNSRMYMVQNIGNPIDETLYNKRKTTIEIDLGDLVGKAKFYYKSKEVKRTLNGTVLKEKIGLGQAIFIEVK